MSRPVKHIERRELYTDLGTRVQYLHSMLDFGESDIEALTTGSKYIKALIPALVNIVYKKLLQYDITARAFVTRSTSYEGPVPEHPDEDSPIIKYRKMFLRGYLTKLCSDPSQFEFWEYLDKVGMMHVGRGREHPLHIEYVHIGATLGMIQDVLLEAILGHPRLSMRRKTALIKALNKVIWIQNDLFAKWYVRDGEEYTSNVEGPPVEEEGYLHGKSILDLKDDEPEEEGAEGGEGARTPVGAMKSECPFSHLAKDVQGLSVGEVEGMSGGAKHHAGAAEASEDEGSDHPAPASPVVNHHSHLSSMSSPPKSPRPGSVSGIPRPVEKPAASS